MICLIPLHMKEALERYVEEGMVQVGDFLEAVISNDFQEAFSRADDYNIAIMFHYAKYVHNKMPIGSHGSRKIFEDWCKSGGLMGQEETRKIALKKEQEK